MKSSLKLSKNPPVGSREVKFAHDVKPGKTQDTGKPGVKPVIKDPEREKEIRRQAEAEARRRRDLEHKTFEAQELVCGRNVLAEDLVLAARYFVPSDYEAVVEERSVARLCGYPLCKRRLPDKEPTGKYKISSGLRKVYDTTESRRFCCNDCHIASDFFARQISPTAVFLRGASEVEATLKFLSLSGTDPLTTTGADTAGSLALEKEVPCATEATAEPSSTVEKKEEVPSRVVVAQQDGAEVESSLQIYERSGDDVDQPSAVYDVDPLAIEGFRATQGSDLFKAKRRGRLNSAGSKARASDDSAAVTSAEKDAQTMQNSVGREADQASAEESKSGLQQAAVEKGHSAQQRVSFAADVSPGTGSAKEYRAARERLLEKKRAKKRKDAMQLSDFALAVMALNDLCTNATRQLLLGNQVSLAEVAAEGSSRADDDLEVEVDADGWPSIWVKDNGEAEGADKRDGKARGQDMPVYDEDMEWRHGTDETIPQEFINSRVTRRHIFMQQLSEAILWMMQEFSINKEHAKGELSALMDTFNFSGRRKTTMYSVPVRRILCIVFFELISSNNEAVARQLHAEESAVLRRVLEDLNIDSAGFDSLVDVFRR